MTVRGTRKAGDDDLLAAALAAGLEVREAARQAGMSLSTAQRRRAQPAFAQHVADLRAEVVASTAGRLLGLGARAVEALSDLLTCENQPTRLAAVRVILDSGPKYREASDLEARLVALERLAAPMIPGHGGAS